MLGYFLAMEKMNKPAWFELADNDQPANVSPKARKGGIFAVVTTLALTGVAGWGFISSEEFPATVASASSAVVEKVTGNLTSESNTTNPITAPTGYEDDDDDDDDNDEDFRPTQSVAVASAAGVASSATVINPPSSAASSTGNNPILPPSGNSDDDDDDNDDDDDDDDHKGDRKKSREDHDDDDEDEDDD